MTDRPTGQRPEADRDGQSSRVSGGGGQPSREPIRLDPSPVDPADLRPVLAVDIGGTKVAVALVDRGGRITSTLRVQTPSGAGVDAEALWRTVVSLVDRFVKEVGPAGVAGVGVGCAGPIDWPAGAVSPLNVPAWQDFPLRERISELIPKLPVRVHNDAMCAAVGEHWRGAGRGRDNMLGMVISSGVGGGLILDGRLVEGANGNAGHVGHVVVDPDGPACSCGGTGCVETYAGGAWLIPWARERGSHATSARELADDAARGHPVALAALQRAAGALGVAIASATNLCNLQLVAISGGLSQAGPLLFDPLEETLRRHARLPFARTVGVVPAALGQEAGLVGAAALVLAGDRYWSAD